MVHSGLLCAILFTEAEWAEVMDVCWCNMVSVTHGNYFGFLEYWNTVFLHKVMKSLHSMDKI